MSKKQHEQSEVTRHSETGGPQTSEARTKARAVKVTAPHITHTDLGLTSEQRRQDAHRANGHKPGISLGLANGADESAPNPETPEQLAPVQQ
jgi:hypothetical protein